MAVLDVRDLTHHYGRQEALHHVSLSITAGTIYALLGPNGSGKTTLLQSMMGLLPAQAGEARIFDTPVQSLSTAQRARIGYVAEGQQLPGRMTLTQLERYLAPLYPDWDASLAASLRERFELDPSRQLRTLSRGEHMKAALLCALAPRPDLLLMDEPFTGMDAAVKDELVRGVLELSGNEGWTVVIASHDLAELDLLADWVGFLDHGRLQLDEPMDTLRARYRWVEIVTRDLEARLPNARPESWVWAEHAGPRVRVLVNEPDDNALQRAARSWYPSAARVEVHEASLRDVFVALTRSNRNTQSSRTTASGTQQEVA